MTQPGADAVKAFILLSLDDRLRQIGYDSGSLPPDFDLLARGVIDSLGFLQLLGTLECRYGTSFDLSSLLPEQATRLDVLSACIAGQLSGGHR